MQPTANVHCTVGTRERAPSESRVAVAERLNTEAGKLTKLIIIIIIIKGHLLPSAKRAGARAPRRPYLCTCLEMFLYQLKLFNVKNL